MPARASFWRSPCLRRRRVSILKVKASTPPILAKILVWQLLYLYQEPWYRVALFRFPVPDRLLRVVRKSSAKAVKYRHIGGFSGQILSPGIRLVLDYFGNDIGLDVIILPFYIAKCCSRTLPLCTEGGSQLMVLRMYADNTRPTDYTYFRLRLSPESPVDNINWTVTVTPIIEFCSLYH